MTTANTGVRNFINEKFVAKVMKGRPILAMGK
jgi:hypothetical protein